MATQFSLKLKLHIVHNLNKGGMILKNVKSTFFKVKRKIKKTRLCFLSREIQFKFLDNWVKQQIFGN
jgi:hypothetical protein